MASFWFFAVVEDLTSIFRNVSFLQLKFSCSINCCKNCPKNFVSVLTLLSLGTRESRPVTGYQKLSQIVPKTKLGNIIHLHENSRKSNENGRNPGKLKIVKGKERDKRQNKGVGRQ